MQLSRVRDIGSSVLRNTSETSMWEDRSCNRPVGQRLHVKNSCGSANHTSSPPVMSKSDKGSKSSKGSNRNGYSATKHKVSSNRGIVRRAPYDIVYDVTYDIVYDIIYDIAYDIAYTMLLLRKRSCLRA